MKPIEMIDLTTMKQIAKRQGISLATFARAYWLGYGLKGADLTNAVNNTIQMKLDL